MAGEEDLGNFFPEDGGNNRLKDKDLCKRTFPLACSTSCDKSNLNDVTFCAQNFVRDFMTMMSMMRNHQMLTDVTLQVGSELFHAHKVVLAAASPYFKAMFTSGLKESEMKKVVLQGVCPTAMSLLITFMYTGQIRVTERTVCQLLPAATMFQVSQEEEFLQLSSIQLVELIRKDELNVQDEHEVYSAVIRWVKYNEEARRPKMAAILQAVRCQFLTPNFLSDQMNNCDVLQKSPNCKEYLSQIFKDLVLHKKVRVKERTPNTPRIIYVVGGYYKVSLTSLIAFNVDTEEWTTLAKLNIARSGLGGMFIKGLLYVVGGRHNSPGSNYDSDWVDRYDPVRDHWRSCNPMSVPRNRVGVCTLDGYIYACGGASSAATHNSVEKYSPEEDQWSPVPAMKTKRLGFGIAVVNRIIYVVGGFDGENRLKSCECYHPERNEWTDIPDMQDMRSGAGVAALNQFIYVAGGYDGRNQLKSVERYDTESNKWEYVASISVARSALTLCMLTGQLYAIGGFDGESFLSIVEVYNPETDVWTEGVSLPSSRSGHACAVSYHQCTIHCEPNNHVNT
ncbi:kelch like ECH associated protein 1 isoform X2 [Lycorma delicatula]|uniref:kelch like ECH associated protein 1 isoform X2 n=1 Tax=Lycorma delicatula TaxID=130591 RepID=UPI003F50E823